MGQVWSILKVMKVERLALELLEYKTQDLVAGKSLGSDGISVKALYTHLNKMRNKLDASEQQRLLDVQRQLKARANAKKTGTNTLSQPNQSAAKAFDLASFAEDTDTPEIAETNTTSSYHQGATFDLYGGFDDDADAPQASNPAPIAHTAPAKPKRTIRLSDAELQEQDTLKQLAQHVWWDGINQRLQNLAMTYRAEPNRHTVRLVYATLRNLALFAKTPAFAKDPELQSFKVKKAIPEYSDPLLSLNDLESLTALLSDIVTTILEFKDPREPYAALDIDEHEVLAYVRRLALAVANDPYAGKLSLVTGKEVTSDQLRMAISQLEREPLGEAIKREQRAQFEARLKETLRHEKSQRDMFNRDTQTYTRAMNDFFDVLEGLLPQRVGGRCKTPQLSGGVLFAENPALRLDNVPPDAKSVTLQLKGPSRFQLAGIDIAISGSAGRGWRVLVKNREEPLSSLTHIDLEGARLYVFEKNNYVHAVVQHHDRPLHALIAESMAVYQVLRVAQNKHTANIINMATGITPDSSDNARQVVRRLFELSNNAPERGKAVKGFLWGAARVIGQQDADKDALQSVVTAMQLAIDAPNMQLAEVVHNIDPQRTALYTLGSKPVKVNVAGQPLTVRKYQARVYGQDLPESVVVMAPGRPLGSFNDYMLQPLSGGMAIFVRASHELAVLHLPF